MALDKRDFNLIKEITWTDFKLRYNSSVLGFFWSFLNPLAMMIVLYLIFSVFINNNIEHFQLFLLLGIITWNFFVEGTSIGLLSVLNKASLITKIRIKREIIVISSCLVSLISFFLNLLVFFMFMLAFRISMTKYVLFFPVIVLILFMIILGISFLLGAFFLKFRDLSHIWQIILQPMFFLTPIFYSVGIIPQKYLSLYMLNPLVSIIESLRASLIFGEMPQLQQLIIPFIIGFVLLIVGYFIFKKREKWFAEEI